MVLWDYRNAPFLAAHNPLVAEIRSGASFFYSITGENTDAAAAAFAADVDTLLRTRSGRNRRLAVDKIMLAGFRALDAPGVAVEDGEIVTERARAVKGPEDIRAMRCALHACETAMAEMRAAARPGLTEDDVWAVLHAENIRRGGEWIETRLLASGPRTNPWFQECGPRVLQQNEILAFDTDLIGPYGFCADLSRTWWIGPGAPRPDMPRRLPRSPATRSPTTPRCSPPASTFAELHDAPVPAAAGLPGAEVLLRLARHRPRRRMALHRLSRPARPRRLRGRAGARHDALRREPDLARGRRLLDQARGAGADHRGRRRDADPLPRTTRRSPGRRPSPAHQPRRAASIAATSIFPIFIIASKARFASAPPAAIASVRVRGVICHGRPTCPCTSRRRFLPPLPTMAFQ